jgi:hypothetical protein
MKILYVEDNEDNIYMLKNRLSRARASEMPTGGLSKRSDSQPEPMVPKKSKMPIIASSGWEYHRLRVDPGIVQRSAAPRSPGKLRKTARKCIRRCNHPRLCPVRRAGGRGYLPRPRGGVAFGQCRAHPPRPPPHPPLAGDTNGAFEARMPTPTPLSQLHWVIGAFPCAGVYAVVAAPGRAHRLWAQCACASSPSCWLRRSYPSRSQP